MVRKLLLSTDSILAGMASYMRLVKADNPLIVKDFMDRVAGKVKEHVEISSDQDTPAHMRLSIEEIKANARFQLEKERTRMLEATNNDNTNDH